MFDAASSVSTEMSGGAPTRTGGPQNPAPRDTYNWVSWWVDNPAKDGCTASTMYWNGQVCPPCV